MNPIVPDVKKCNNEKNIFYIMSDALFHLPNGTERGVHSDKPERVGHRRRQAKPALLNDGVVHRGRGKRTRRDAAQGSRHGGGDERAGGISDAASQQHGATSPHGRHPRAGDGGRAGRHAHRRPRRHHPNLCRQGNPRERGEKGIRLRRRLGHQTPQH